MKLFASLFATLGLMALGYWAVAFVTARRYQAKEERRFANERRAESLPADTSGTKLPTKEERVDPNRESTVAMLIIPRLGLSTIVLEGAEERELKLGPGHIRGTSQPGDGGNVGVAGHRDAVFRPLRLIRINDEIKIITRGQEYRYEVVSTKIVEPDDIKVLYPTGHETLTLVTCYPFNFVGAAPERFIVRADCTSCRGQSTEEPSK